VRVLHVGRRRRGVSADIQELAAAFERETGCALHVRELGDLTMLLPDDDRFGNFGILVGRRATANFRFETRAYGGVELVLYGSAQVRELDAVLRRITAAGAS
jgi:hypothetical protein